VPKPIEILFLNLTVLTVLIYGLYSNDSEDCRDVAPYRLAEAI
jgi:hypothetical protein